MKRIRDIKSVIIVIGTIFTGMLRRAYKDRTKKHKIFSASLIDIKKILARKKYTDPFNKLLKALYKHLELFNEVAMDRLPPYHLGVDYKINLLKDEKG